jgi:hypothetical protein
MCPTFRGEYANPGKKEFLFGEVSDLLSAVDYLNHSESVDANRVYLVGSDEGATLTLLAMGTQTTKVRAAFAIGGWLQSSPQLIVSCVPKGTADKIIQLETYLRSPLYFLSYIKMPTFHFGTTVLETEKLALKDSLFQEIEIPDRSSPKTDQVIWKLIEKKIQSDTQPEETLKITKADLQSLTK